MRYRLVLALAGLLLLTGCGSASPGASSPGASATQPTASTSPSSLPTPSASGTTAANCRRPPYYSADYFGSNALTGVEFVSADQGWVVGAREILATTNGGASWTIQDKGALDLESVDFISSQVGWAVGADSLLFTADGGVRWTALPEPCPVISSVHFVSAQVGFALAGGSGPAWTGTTPPGMGGVLLTTSDGGSSWRQLPAPANPQSVCFSNPASGWLGAGGELFSSNDGGREWTLRSAGVRVPLAHRGLMHVQCAQGSVWAEEIGPGAAMSQEPHVAFHGGTGAVLPIFAEQYFPHPGVSVKAESPGVYAGPVSGISASTAVFVDWCDACGWGTVQWDLATDGGSTLTPEGNVGQLNQPEAASFLNPSVGWVVGIAVLGNSRFQRIVYTDDGGQTWQLQYSAN